MNKVGKQKNATALSVEGVNMNTGEVSILDQEEQESLDSIFLATMDPVHLSDEEGDFMTRGYIEATESNNYLPNW